MNLLNNSPLRRYTPPTCTLELWDKRSYFSRWRQKAAFEELNFVLKFDDPRLLEEEQITLEGTLPKLEILSNVVGSYVQNILHQTINCLAVTHNSSVEETACLTSVSPPEKNGSKSEKSLSLPPTLQPQGFLFHELVLGSLDTQAIHKSVNLTASQLFDLLNALEEYHRDITSLSSPQNATRFKGVWIWTSAVTVALLAIGIPTIGLKWFEQLNPTGTSLNTQLDDEEQNLSFLDVLPPVPPPPKGPMPAPSLAPLLATKDPLPPPEKIGQATPPPRNRSAEIQAPTLAVLPPPPVVPPAPPKPNTVQNNAVSNSPPPEDLLKIPAPGMSMIMAPSSTTVASRISAIPSLPAPPPLQAKSLAVRSPDQNIQESPTPETPIRNPLNTAKPAPEMSLLDTIPQVAEARQYFQQRWEPPQDLSQTLEYRLIVQSDGSLKQAIPLGKAATLYYRQTGIPNPGSSFVSQLGVEGNQTIRLVLIPNGKVKTFLE
ncbi:MAG TPA: hypothetical protein DCF68_20410 [Cyanothece sp. UBA12306]|nr:hypothetical protein [Cyanothece sp. UBA12306]